MWTPEVNSLFDANMQGVQAVYDRFAEANFGFNFNSAREVLNSASVNVDPKLLK